jgi:hypothetical protein
MQAAPPATKLASSVSVLDVVIWLAETTAHMSPETFWWCFYNASDLSEEANETISWTFSYPLIKLCLKVLSRRLP